MRCYGVFCAGYSIVNREVASYLELDKYCVDGWNTRVKVTFTAKIEWIEFEEGGRHTPPMPRKAIARSSVMEKQMEICQR